MARSDQPGRSRPNPILIVEDDERCLQLWHDVLELHGYRVVGTGLGAAAVHLAREHHPDLIILDIRLPDISGLEAVRQLKAEELTRMIPIIAVTAVAMREDERKILNCGCDLYVAKPFKPSAFIETVARFLDQRAVVLAERGETPPVT